MKMAKCAQYSTAVVVVGVMKASPVGCVRGSAQPAEAAAQRMDRLHRLAPLGRDSPPPTACTAANFSWENLERDSIEGLSKAFLVVR